MKIEGNNNIKALAGTQIGDSRTRAAAESPRQTEGAGGNVQFSPLSASLAKAETIMSSTPVVDPARVEEIRQAISEGRFKVDAERIADGLLASVRQMLDAQIAKS